MMRQLFARFVDLFKAGSAGEGEQVTRKNVDKHTSRIRAKADTARLKLRDVERSLEHGSSECQE